MSHHIAKTEYYPQWFLRNGHINTIYPTLFRSNPNVNYNRERIITDDDDFLDIDLLRASNPSLAVICHGLEGSSASKYVLGTAAHLHSNNWDVAAMNYRGCSGELNKQRTLYHSGATYDLHTIIEHFGPQYDTVVLVGFSLGGNLVLKYIGDGKYKLPCNLKAVVAISVPVDLHAGCINISRKSNFIYQHKFLKSLKAKLHLKAAQFPDTYKIRDLKHVKTLYDFDNLFTGPIHGFEDALDYYTKCSSLQHIEDIQHPTLVINALDDPFLPDECYPYKEINNNNYVSRIFPKYGGHVGFSSCRDKVYWEEDEILNFINRSDASSN